MIPPQITRLILLTLFIVMSYLLAREVLTPESFGKYGWYRAAALQEIAAREPLYASRKSCIECHESEAEMVGKFEHQTLSCVTCHGPSREHLEEPELVGVEKLDDAGCLRCHAAQSGKPEWFRQIVLADHWQDFGEACIDCHLPHHPKEAPPLEEEEEEAAEGDEGNAEEAAEDTPNE